MYFDTRLTADFTEFDPLYERQFEPIESDFTFVPLPSRNLNMTFRVTHDPNPHPDEWRAIQGGRIPFQHPLHTQSLGTSASEVPLARDTPRGVPARSITATGRYRVSRNSGV